LGNKTVAFGAALVAQSFLHFASTAERNELDPSRATPKRGRQGLVSAIATGERPRWLPLLYAVMLIVPGIRKLGFAVLVTAVVCLTISRLGAADPSVEVFTDAGTVTTAGGRDISFLPQLPFRWSLTVNGGYDDNVNTTPEAVGSAFTQANLTLSKDLRTARTQLSMKVSGGLVHYFDRMGGPPTDYTGSINLTLQHNVSERLTLGASVNAAYLSEPAFGTDLGSVRRSGSYFSTTDTLSARYMWSPRLSTYTSYQLGMVSFEDALVSAAQDRIDHTFGESLRYRWSERTTLIGEYKFELIDYDTAPRDSSTHFALGGLEYQISPRSKASLLGGATFRKFKQGNGDELIDPNGSASFNYLLDPSLSLGWAASYSVEEPNFTETLTQKTIRLRTGLEAKYQPGKHLTAHLALNYYHAESSGVLASGSPGVAGQKFTENGFELVVEGRYAVTDRLFFDLRFAHTALDSIAGYSRNVSTAGFTFNF
jgi:Putative beta-barrel porin 2